MGTAPQIGLAIMLIAVVCLLAAIHERLREMLALEASPASDALKATEAGARTLLQGASTELAVAAQALGEAAKQLKDDGKAMHASRAHIASKRAIQAAQDFRA